MSTDVHQGPLDAAPQITAPAKKTGREKRWERRRRRVWFEELLGWILVPVIVIGAYYLLEGILAALGTSLSAIIDGIRMITQSL